MFNLLQERLREKMKELDTVEEELGASIRDKKSKIKVLEEDAEQSRTEMVSMEAMIVEMKKEMFSMEEKLDVLEGGVKEKELLQLRANNKDLEEAEEMAREELEVSLLCIVLVNIAGFWTEGGLCGYCPDLHG